MAVQPGAGYAGAVQGAERMGIPGMQAWEEGSSQQLLPSPAVPAQLWPQQTALLCLHRLQLMVRFVQCPGRAQWVSWHRRDGWEQKNNIRASGVWNYPLEK